MSMINELESILSTEFETEKVKYTIGEYYFTWNDRKYIKNLKQHNVRFESAAEAILDPYSIEHINKDSFLKDNDERIEALCKDYSTDVLVVIFVERIILNSRDYVYRIISARKADKQEESFYEERKRFSKK